jgi:hypothetical protein
MERSRSADSQHFFLELTSGDEGWQDLSAIAARARSAALDHSRSGASDVLFVRSVYAPESNSLFLVYRASSKEAVLAAARAADLTPRGVSPAIDAADGGSP